MRGIKTPFVVDFTSRIDEAFGVVVPMPTDPVEGKVFCAKEILQKKISSATKSEAEKMFFPEKNRGLTIVFIPCVFDMFLCFSLKKNF